MKNLFDYAKKELSQDAFLMWLFENLNNDAGSDEELKEAGIGLLNEFGINVSYDEIEHVWTKGQWYKMDISVHIKTKTKTQYYGLYIEDKTGSSEHNQLKKYNDAIEKIKKNKSITEVHKIYYKTTLMDDWEKDAVKDAGWMEYEFERITKFWKKYCDSKNVILNMYANHICTIGDNSNNIERPEDDNVIAWKSYFDKVLVPLLEKENCWCSTLQTRFGYSCLQIRPAGFTPNSPFLEIRSRDCVNNSFMARILVYEVQDPKGRDYVKTIRDNIRKRKENGIFKGNNGEKQDKQLGKTIKEKYVGLTDDAFKDALMESVQEFKEIVKFWMKD